MSRNVVHITSSSFTAPHGPRLAKGWSLAGLPESFLGSWQRCTENGTFDLQLSCEPSSLPFVVSEVLCFCVLQDPLRSQAVYSTGSYRARPATPALR